MLAEKTLWSSNCALSGTPFFPSTPFVVGGMLKLALIGFVFFMASARQNLHKPLLMLIIRHFDPPANWLCFFNSGFQPPDKSGG